MPRTAAFVISLDLELLWGSHDRPITAGDLRRARGARGAVQRLLQLFQQYEVPATWAVIGHLYLDQAERDPQGRPHPCHPRPQHHWVQGDWFARLPTGDASSCPEWYGPDLVSMIQEAQPAQEIGSHSFSHVIFADRGCDETVARAEIGKCIELARKRGIQLRSFVFPRNQVGHLRLLKEFGFEVFRGLERNLYWRLPRPLRGPIHALDRIMATTPIAALPQRTPEGLIDLPGSMLYLPRTGWRRYIPIRRRVLQARKGLHDAARRNAVFHLWLHPEAMAEDEEGMFAGLAAILDEAIRLRRARRLEFLRMYDAATEYLG